MALWTQRNIDEHGSDEDTRQQAKQKTLCREVTFACATKDDRPDRLQHLFEIPLETLLTKKNNQLQNWLSLWQPVLEMEHSSSESEESSL